MDIPFEKVSVQDAKAAMDEHGSAAPAGTEKNWLAVRHSQDSVQLQMTKEVMAWLSALPHDVRPRALAIYYPRIFNKIAELWGRPLLCEKYLDELLLDERGTRKGFPPDVAGEITTLKNYFISTAKTQHFGVWGERIGG